MYTIIYAVLGKEYHINMYHRLILAYMCRLIVKLNVTLMTIYFPYVNNIDIQYGDNGHYNVVYSVDQIKIVHWGKSIFSIHRWRMILYSFIVYIYNC